MLNCECYRTSQKAIIGDSALRQLYSAAQADLGLAAFFLPVFQVLELQGLLMLLQNLPTIHWGNEEIGLLLAEAYRLKYMFADAPNHYRR
ncbi:hypothetical protein U0070_026370 [Myodes glareolus]|uniref:Uncharacterized protein n=1 Tax=Myodes glareolus TaxID=447135 RepID=A0AAW0IKN6_MYOGA